MTWISWTHRNAWQFSKITLNKGKEETKEAGNIQAPGTSALLEVSSEIGEGFAFVGHDLHVASLPERRKDKQ